jgi:hypothetical protein
MEEEVVEGGEEGEEEDSKETAVIDPRRQDRYVFQTTI